MTAIHACGLDKLRRDDLFTDITLIVGGREFRAHRVILAARSDYFLHLFTSGMKETSSERITLHEVEANVFGHILDIVYTGDVSEAASASFDVLNDVLIAADMWQIAGLEADVLRHLAEVAANMWQGGNFIETKSRSFYRQFKPQSNSALYLHCQVHVSPSPEHKLSIWRQQMYNDCLF